MKKYGIILDDADQHIGAWRVLDDNHLELNLEDGQIGKMVELAETAGEATLKFMIDPEAIDY